MLKPIKLFGEQKRVLFLPHTNPIQIKGVAGSGKTTVALYRAKHLQDTYVDLYTTANVAIFTFNKSLVTYIGKAKGFIGGGIQKDTDEIARGARDGLDVTVLNFHKWAWRYLQGCRFWDTHTVASTGQRDAAVQRSIEVIRRRHGDKRILAKYVEFYREEYSWIKGQLLASKDAYIAAARIGRGGKDRVTTEDKRLLWECYEAYQQRLHEQDLVDFDDFAVRVLERMGSGFAPPYSHIVVDEAQDLSKAQMKVLARLVKPETNSITIIADAAQRIYKSGFTWSEVGLNVRGGRTIEFKRNYRNTVAVARAAASLLDHEPDKSEFTIIETARKGGHKPVVGYFDSWEEQAEYVLDLIEETWYTDEETVVLHRTNSGVAEIAEFLTEQGIPIVSVRDGSDPFGTRAVKVCTLSSVKGLEFDNVIIVDLNEDEIPYPDGFNEDDDEYHISTERRLLYTAMTRARERLFLLSSGEPTRYLAEIKSDYVDIVGEPPEPIDPSRNLADDDLPF
jgi:superfamily I DNA/RNA helicase